MGVKLKVSGWIALGAVAGALTTMQLTAIARSPAAALPLEELQQLAAVFGMELALATLDTNTHLHVSFDVDFLDPAIAPGVGIEIGMEDGLVKVVSPIEGSPAFRAGLKSGDLITKIDEQVVRGLTVDQAVKRMMLYRRFLFSVHSL